MTADNRNDTTGSVQVQGATPRGRKAPRKSGAAKRGRSLAARRAAATEPASRSRKGSAAGTRNRSRSARSSSSASSGGIGARLLATAGRAIPLVSHSIPDQRMVQRLVDERPYMLGAIGLGIGAMIGLMLPGTLSSMTRHAARGRGR